VLALYGISILKILSVYLLPLQFSKYYLGYNLSLYLYTFIFSLQASVLLRYYHRKSKFILAIFLYKVNTLIFIFTLIFYFILVYYEKLIFIDSIFILLFCITFGFYNIKITFFRIKGDFESIVIVQIIQIILSISLLFFSRNRLNPSLVFFIISVTNILPFIFIKNSFKFKIFKLKKYILNQNELEFIKYGVPIILIAFITFALSSSDQFFLKHYNYTNQLSSYIANYNIAEKGVLIILSVISFVFQPFFFKKHENLTKIAIIDVVKASTYFLAFAVVIFILLKNFSIELTMLLSSEEYIALSWIMPIVFIGGVFIGLNSIFAELLTLSYKTNLLLISYLVGFSMSLILNFLFIPKYGFTAAVWNSVISYFTMFVTTIIFIIYQWRFGVKK
jgi:O-antigen/teichoic acid export membrane protein